MEKTLYVLEGLGFKKEKMPLENIRRNFRVSAENRENIDVVINGQIFQVKIRAFFNYMHLSDSIIMLILFNKMNACLREVEKKNMWLHFKQIHSLRFKLIVSLMVVALFIGLISVLVGGNLLYRSVIAEANNRIQQDLNVARLIFDDRINNIRLSLKIIASVTNYENEGPSKEN